MKSAVTPGARVAGRTIAHLRERPAGGVRIVAPRASPDVAMLGMIGVNVCVTALTSPCARPSYIVRIVAVFAVPMRLRELGREDVNFLVTAPAVHRPTLVGVVRTMTRDALRVPLSEKCGIGDGGIFHGVARHTRFFGFARWRVLTHMTSRAALDRILTLGRMER